MSGTRRLRSWLLCSWVVSSTIIVVPAQGGADAERDRMIEELLESSGIRYELEQACPAEQAYIDEAFVKGSEEHRFQTELLKSSCSEGEGAAIYRHQFQENFNGAEAIRVLRELDDPIAAKFTKLNMKCSEPEGHLREMRSLCCLDLSDPTLADRLALIDRLERMTRGTERVLEIWAVYQFTLEQAYSSRLGMPRKVTDKTFSDFFREFRRSEEEFARRAFRVRMLECYRSATDEEIERYIATADLDVSDWFNQSLIAANKAVMIAHGREAADVYLRWNLKPGETPSHRLKDSTREANPSPTP